MTADMEDENFFDLFKASFPSVFAARIMRLPDGTSKQFAFVRFRDEDEYHQALAQEARISLLLGCQVRICKAHPRPPPQPRRWSAAGQQRLLPGAEAASQLIDPSAVPAKFATEQPRVQSSPSGHPPVPQPFLPDPLQPVYYIPVPGYPVLPDGSTGPGFWSDLYASVPVPDVPAHVPHSYAQPMGPAAAAAAAPEAGDVSVMHSYQSFARATWQLPLSLPPAHVAHYLPDQRFLYCAGEVSDAGDRTKDGKSADAAQVSQLASAAAAHGTPLPPSPSQD